MEQSGREGGGKISYTNVYEYGEFEFRDYVYGGEEFEVAIPPSSNLVSVSLDCDLHHHQELILLVDSVEDMKAWEITKKVTVDWHGELDETEDANVWLTVREGTRDLDADASSEEEFDKAVGLCSSILLNECRDCVQVDEFFPADVGTTERRLVASILIVTEEDDGMTLDKRVYEYEGRRFEAVRTSPDSAAVNLKCRNHTHEDFIVGTIEGEKGWLIGRKESDDGPRGPIEKFANAVEWSCHMLVEECSTVVQLNASLEEEVPTPKERLDALAAFLPKFEKPSFEFGRMESPPGVMPYYTLSPLASCFVKTCYEMDWVKPFEWAEWKDSPEAVRLRDDPSALEKATFEQLSRLLTVVIRQDRFVEGALGSTFESGLLSGILRRAAVLATDSPSNETACN